MKPIIAALAPAADGNWEGDLTWARRELRARHSLNHPRTRALLGDEEARIAILEIVEQRCFTGGPRKLRTWGKRRRRSARRRHGGNRGRARRLRRLIALRGGEQRGFLRALLGQRDDHDGRCGTEHRAEGDAPRVGPPGGTLERPEYALERVRARGACRSVQ